MADLQNQIILGIFVVKGHCVKIFTNPKNKIMKKLKLLIAAGALLMFSLGVNAQMAGTSHDFSPQTWSNGEICLPCHTPHNGAMMAEAPLWNHQLTTANFTLYTSSTLDAVMGQPDGNSKLCLSCHDGTVALENFGGITNGTTHVTGTALVGTDLTNDHPVSFVYNTALANTDGGLFDPSNTQSGLGGTITNTMLFSDKLQCASCHDVHNKYGINGLLVKTNAGSALCLTCHNK
jgi:predicted CXXCH cytochrome family protein